jgi:hypothetical protein
MYLIRHENPKEYSCGYRWNLAYIKLNDVPHTGSSSLAFDTEDEAVSFATTLNPAFQYSAVRCDRIGLDTFVVQDSYMLVVKSHSNFWARKELGDLSHGPFVKLALRAGITGLIRRVKDWNRERTFRGKVES